MRLIVAAMLAAAAGMPALAQQDPGAGAAAVPVAASSGPGPGAVPVEGSIDGDVTTRGYVPAPPCRPVFSEAAAAPIGPVLGDAEKDNIARVVTGLDCG